MKSLAVVVPLVGRSNRFSDDIHDKKYRLQAYHDNNSKNLLQSHLNRLAHDAKYLGVKISKVVYCLDKDDTEQINTFFKDKLYSNIFDEDTVEVEVLVEYHDNNVITIFQGLEEILPNILNPDIRSEFIKYDGIVILDPSTLVDDNNYDNIYRRMIMDYYDNPHYSRLALTRGKGSEYRFIDADGDHGICCNCIKNCSSYEEHPYSLSIFIISLMDIIDLLSSFNVSQYYWDDMYYSGRYPVGYNITDSIYEFDTKEEYLEVYREINGIECKEVKYIG